MDRMFVAGEGFPRSFTRVNARGYKNLEIAEDVTYSSYVDLFSEGNTLVLRSVERQDAEGTDEAYMILCREIGFAGLRGSDKFKSDVSVIFLDNGWMLVTLWKGACMVNLDGKMVVPNTGVASYPDVPDGDICWVNRDKLLDYGRYIKDVGQFLFDLEIRLRLGGDNTGGMESFSFTHLGDEDIDLSLGYIARYLQENEMRQESKVAQDIVGLLNEKIEYDYGDEDEDYSSDDAEDELDEDEDSWSI